ncbi:MAG: lipid kinase [Candidatus Meridianibacter frigidus]|nr:MAG: lipid kinase [Candidatus Eremiobacteraeota bacterium]
MRVLLFMNPHARRGDSLADEARNALRAAGCVLVEEPMSDANEMRSAMVQRRADADAVVVGGGDGSVITAIPGLLESGLPLGILPLGTFNDLARTLAIPAAIEEAVEIIAAQTKRVVDVGHVNDAYFINEASLGISTRIAHAQTSEVKKKFGLLSILSTTLATLRYTRPFHVALEYEGKKETFRTLQLTIANSHHFGGFITNKDAAIDDGFLDLYSLEVSNAFQMLQLLAPIIRGDVSASKRVRARRAKQFRVTSTRPRPIFADGEPAGETPAEFTVLPKALTVFAPPEDSA